MPGVPLTFTAATSRTLAPVSQDYQFAWITICAAAPCTASAVAIAALIPPEPTSETTVGAGTPIAPLNPGC